MVESGTEHEAGWYRRKGPDEHNGQNGHVDTSTGA
jgi:hypothetical protein